MEGRKVHRNKLDPYHDQLIAWIDEGLTLSEIARRCWAQFKLRTSLGSLSHWHRRIQERIQQEKILDGIRAASQSTADINAAQKDNPPPSTDEIIRLLRVIVQQLLVRGVVDPVSLKLAGDLLRYVLERDRQEQQARSIDLDVAKYQRDTAGLVLKHALDARIREIAAGAGTNDEKTEAVGRHIFGDDWKIKL